MALANSASSKSERDEGKERAWFVSGSDAPSAVHRLLGKPAIARSGRECVCHGKETYLVATNQGFANSLIRPVELPQAQLGDAEFRLTRSSSAAPCESAAGYLLSVF